MFVFYLNTHYSPIYRPAVSNKLVPPLIFQLSPKGFYNSGYNVKLKLLYSEIQDDSFCISSSVFVFVFVKETVISFAGRLFFSLTNSVLAGSPEPSHVFSANITNKASLNGLSTSECLSIDRVCLLSACPETCTEFFHCPVLIISNTVSYQNGGLVMGSVLEVAGVGGSVQVLNCPSKFPDGTRRPQMSRDSWNSCACCP